MYADELYVTASICSICERIRWRARAVGVEGSHARLPICGPSKVFAKMVATTSAMFTSPIAAACANMRMSMDSSSPECGALSNGSKTAPRQAIFESSPVKGCEEERASLKAASSSCTAWVAVTAPASPAARASAMDNVWSIWKPQRSLILETRFLRTTLEQVEWPPEGTLI